MKRTLVLLAVLGTAHVVAAQGAPSTVSFVARLSDNGTPITGQHDFTFALFNAASGGTALWSEDRTGVPVPTDGLLYLDLGSVTALDAVVLDGAKKYLEMTIDGAVSSPRIVIESVPYAIRAGTCAKATDTDALQSHPASYFQRSVINSCNAGQSIQTINADGTVTCETDLDTTYTAGTGLSLVANTFAVDPTMTQLRVVGSCTAGNAIRVINQDGSVTCEPVTGGGGGYTAAPGGGLTLAGNAFSVDTTLIQARVTGTCSTGSAIQTVTANGLVTCEAHIQNQTAAAQTATYFITGTARTSGLVRTGAENGNSDAPTVGLATYDGIVHRRAVSATKTAGQVLARTDVLSLERDGTDGGWLLRNAAVTATTGAQNIGCHGIDSGNTPRDQTIDLPIGTGAGTTPLYADGVNLEYLSCTFGSDGGHTTEVTVHRFNTGNTNVSWTGFLTSTFNQ